MKTKTLLLAVVGTMAVMAMAVEDYGAAEVTAALDRAERSYDTEAATRALTEARTLYRRQPSTATADLHVRASLLAAELLRIEFEEMPKGERAARRTLGGRIDVTAQEALGLLDTLQESSENERRRADLIATMIRSDYRAKKYRNEFNDAVGRALELDDDNTRAWVAAAKPFLFASPEHGGDLNEAVRLLTEALEVEPELESARLLRAFAYDQLGEPEAAAADWRAALDRNPDCEPARRGLEEHANGSHQ
jgi:tetratricopeptide (TPR) repeat protein